MSGRRKKGTPAGLHRLPPGRHGLPREFVIRNQRDRLAVGVIAAVAEHGFNDASITDIAAAAGVSRRTFYAYFSSKEECYFDTYEMIFRHLREATNEASGAEQEWTEKVRARVLAMLEFFAVNPDLVRFVMIAPPRAGEKIAAHFRRHTDQSLEELTADIPADARRPTEPVQAAMVGGIITVIVRQVESGEGERLPDLLPTLLELFLAPYLGPAEAARLAREPA